MGMFEAQNKKADPISGSAENATVQEESMRRQNMGNVEISVVI